MKYLEELSNGDTFKLLNDFFVITTDFKKNGQKLCVNLKTGQQKWIQPDCYVDISPIYSIDQNNNFLPIKEYKNNETTKNTNIS